MKRIKKETELLFKLTFGGEIPGYPAQEDENTYFGAESACSGLTEYNSAEYAVLEQQLKELWDSSPSMKKCIPIILAAVEKSRLQEKSAVERTELYNYTM